MPAAHSHHTHHHGHDHAHTPGDLVAAAVRLCQESGRQFTPLRRRVFETLAEAKRPLGAYDIVETLGQEKRISPISVYRALDFLIEAGLIHRIATRNTYLPCLHLHHADEATVFLVCTRCGSVAEVSSPEIRRGLSGLAASEGFVPGNGAIEIEGDCALCRDAGARA